MNEFAMDHGRVLDTRDVAGGLDVEVDALDVRVVPDDEAFPSLVRVIGRAWLESHAQFLFPENRDFPAEAETFIRVDGE